MPHEVVIVMSAGAARAGWSNGTAVATLYAPEGAKVRAHDSWFEAARESQSRIASNGDPCSPGKAGIPWVGFLLSRL